MQQSLLRLSYQSFALFLGLLGWSAGAWAAPYLLSDLGALAAGSSSAEGISERGQVVGWSDATGSGLTHAARWQAGRVFDLNPAGLASLTSVARGINMRAQVVGSFQREGLSPLAFLWDPQRGVTVLGSLGGSYSDANAINEQGQVVGVATLGDQSGRAFSWQAGSGMRDLGTLGGAYSGAAGVNNLGQVVGWSELGGAAAGQMHAFLWQADRA